MYSPERPEERSIYRNFSEEGEYVRGRKGRIFGIVPMTGELAAKIASWEYPGEYAVYNLDEGSPAEELLDGSSYALLNSRSQDTRCRGWRIP